MFSSLHSLTHSLFLSLSTLTYQFLFPLGYAKQLTATTSVLSSLCEVCETHIIIIICFLSQTTRPQTDADHTRADIQRTEQLCPRGTPSPVYLFLPASSVSSCAAGKTEQPKGEERKQERKRKKKKRPQFGFQQIFLLLSVSLPLTLSLTSQKVSLRPSPDPPSLTPLSLSPLRLKRAASETWKQIETSEPHGPHSSYDRKKKRKAIRISPKQPPPACLLALV